jgi:hypothetical protein
VPELIGGPPADLGHVLGREVEPRRQLEGLDADQVAVLALAAKAERRVELVLPVPEQRAELEVVKPELLRELAP